MYGLDYASLNCIRWFTWELCLHCCLLRGIQNKADPQQTEEESQMRFQPASTMVGLQSTVMACSLGKGQKWRSTPNKLYEGTWKFVSKIFHTYPVYGIEKQITVIYFQLSETQHGWRNGLGKPAVFCLPHTLDVYMSCGLCLPWIHICSSKRTAVQLWKQAPTDST